jgi:hypothetical protein
MSKTQTDEELMKLARELEHIKFPDPDGACAAKLQKDLCLSNVASTSGMNGCYVRFNVLRSRQVIGWTWSLVAACRFADMAKRRLTRYRYKVHNKTTCWNFSEAQAILDEQTNPAAVALLDRICARLDIMQSQMEDFNKIEVLARLRDLEKRVDRLEKTLGL